MEEAKENPEITCLKDDISKQAHVVVLEQFPKKIIELNQLLDSEMFNMTDMSRLHFKLNLPSIRWNGQPEEDNVFLGKKRKLEDRSVDAKEKVTNFNGPIVSNSKLVEVIGVVKPEIVEVVDNCNKLKIWVQLMIPKIEDGNNFGVGIQEDILSEVSKAESDAGSYLEQMSRYYSTRAKLVSKAAKYPELDDYRRGINEYDEKVYLSFKLILRELRNIYVVLYDVIIKNFEKLVRPRNSNTSSLY